MKQTLPPMNRRGWKSLGKPFDVLLLDVMLPERDGFALCREIRKNSDVPIKVNR